MTLNAVENSSSLPTWNNINDYAEMLLRYSYLAAWDSLHAAFDISCTVLTATSVVPGLQASVSFPRVFAWLGIGILMTLSGIMPISPYQNSQIGSQVYHQSPAAPEHRFQTVPPLTLYQPQISTGRHFRLTWSIQQIFIIPFAFAARRLALYTVSKELRSSHGVNQLEGRGGSDVCLGAVGRCSLCGGLVA